MLMQIGPAHAATPYSDGRTAFHRHFKDPVSGIARRKAPTVEGQIHRESLMAAGSPLRLCASWWNPALCPCCYSAAHYLLLRFDTPHCRTPSPGGSPCKRDAIRDPSPPIHSPPSI